MGKAALNGSEGRYDRSMRFRAPLFAFFFVVGLVVPLAAQATIPFFGPIVPEAVNLCAAGWGAVIDVVNRIIELLITIAIVFIAPLMIAWAGFLYVVNPVDPGGIAKARSILTNTVVGIVIALAGWLIVDAVMAVLYNSTTPVSDGSVLKTWSSIISSGDKPFCLIREGSLYKLNQTTYTGVSANNATMTPSGKTVGLCSPFNLACSPDVLQQVGFTQAQANVMSCIAANESSGIPATPPYNIAHPGSNSTACGTFQITKSTWNKNATGSCADFSNCMNAACNVQVAKTLVAKNEYKDWTCANCNSKAQTCIQQYGG